MKNTFVWGDDELPPAELLRDLIETMLAQTYPSKTLNRRLKLLTDNEMKSAIRLYRKMVDACQKLDDLISERAEREQDKWP